MAGVQSFVLGGRRVLALLVLVLVLAGLVTAFVVYTNIREERGTAASDVLSSSEETPFIAIDGSTVSFEDYRGKVRVVNVWASWSPYAATELPLLASVAGQYADRGVVALALNRNEPREIAEAYLATLPPLPGVVPIIDASDAFFAGVGGYAMPETVIFNARGDIVWHYRGVLTEAALGAALDTVLSSTNQ